MSTPIRKAVVSSFGDVSHISIVSDQVPTPPASNVQVAVVYSGFSGADVNMRLGTYPMQRQAPLTPGYCMVGRVVSNGPGCSRFQIGDTVACLTVYDAEATRANFPEKYLVAVPQGVGLQEATALILDWNTAYGMVMRAANVSSGQKIFVHGMSGAVGYAVMALSRLQGATVYGTASERNHAAIKALGGHPFVYTNKNWINEMNAIGGVDAIFDPLGFESWDESFSVLAQNGILVGYGGNARSLGAGEGTSRSIIWPTLKLFARNLLPGKRTSFYYISRDQKTFEPELQALFKLLQAGKIDVKIKQVWDLEDIREAHQSWGKGTGVGSLLIKVGNENES